MAFSEHLINISINHTSTNRSTPWSDFWFQNMDTTVKILKIWTPEKVAVIILNLKNCFYCIEMHRKDVDGMANSVDPDQTAPLGEVWSGSALFAHTYLSENLWSLRYMLQNLKFYLQFSGPIFRPVYLYGVHSGSYKGHEMGNVPWYIQHLNQYVVLSHRSEQR